VVCGDELVTTRVMMVMARVMVVMTMVMMVMARVMMVMAIIITNANAKTPDHDGSMHNPRVYLAKQWTFNASIQDGGTTWLRSVVSLIPSTPQPSYTAFCCFLKLLTMPTDSVEVFSIGDAAVQVINGRLTVSSSKGLAESNISLPMRVWTVFCLPLTPGFPPHVFMEGQKVLLTATTEERIVFGAATLWCADSSFLYELFRAWRSTGAGRIPVLLLGKQADSVCPRQCSLRDLRSSVVAVATHR
ncbi:hypothetical protein FHG87_020119, partial [Trinorchestia longiramus]